MTSEGTTPDPALASAILTNAEAYVREWVPQHERILGGRPSPFRTLLTEYDRRGRRLEILADRPEPIGPVREGLL